MNYNFNEVIDEYSRMCEKLQSNCTPETCPVYDLIMRWENEHNEIWDDRCIVFARENPDAFANVVMTWAHENPRNIYPTIREVVTNMAIKSGLSTADLKDIFLVMNTRLSEEAANSLGILPINECKLV